MAEFYVSPTWRCQDCGVKTPTREGGVVIRGDHADCDTQALVAYQAQKAAWWEGYRFALENYGDELVQADKREYGTGWRRIAAAGVTIRAEGGQVVPSRTDD